MWHTDHMGQDFFKLFLLLLKPSTDGLDLFKVIGGKPVQQQPFLLKNESIA